MLTHMSVMKPQFGSYHILNRPQELSFSYTADGLNQVILETADASKILIAPEASCDMYGLKRPVFDEDGETLLCMRMNRLKKEMARELPADAPPIPTKQKSPVSETTAVEANREMAAIMSYLGGYLKKNQNLTSPSELEQLTRAMHVNGGQVYYDRTPTGHARLRFSVANPSEIPEFKKIPFFQQA